ncbi:hypothetical protein SRHO_G00097670 [Serrasalmus rhombeus]
MFRVQLSSDVAWKVCVSVFPASHSSEWPRPRLPRLEPSAPRPRRQPVLHAGPRRGSSSAYERSAPRLSPHQTAAQDRLCTCRYQTPPGVSLTYVQAFVFIRLFPRTQQK